jgi:uncharacterized repeat protein (TIGR01451 family)
MRLGSGARAAILCAGRAAALSWLALSASHALAAQVACTPDAGFNTCVRFTYSGANQSFTVPAGLSSIGVRMWAGGGGGFNSTYYGNPGGGGSGGYTEGTVAVTGGSVFTVVVGGGGKVTGSSATFGGGGAGGKASDTTTLNGGSSGGGYSGLFSGSTVSQANARLMAGGGGGMSNGVSGGVFGPGGGGTNGRANTTDVTDRGLYQPAASLSGRGGTQSAGGAAATTTGSGCATGTGGATAGSALAGGKGADNGEGGGGGGGGYYGGGGGRCQTGGPDPQNGPGGGGSGFILGSGVSAATTTDGNDNKTASAVAPPQATNSQYVTGVGSGGGGAASSNLAAGNGGDGLVVIQYSLPIRLRLNKSLPAGRDAAGDQFKLSILNGNTGLASATTTGGTNAPTETADYTTSGSGTYTLSEAAAGTANLANYTSSISCTNAATGSTTTLPSGSGTSFTVTPAGGDDISCTFTNTLKTSTITLQKALGGTGRIDPSDQFTLSASGDGAPAAISTSGNATTVTSGPYTFNGTKGSTYVLNESMSPGSASALSLYDQAVSCTNTGPTAVSGQTALPITLTPVAADNISCVITNTPKSTDGGSGGNPPSLICNGDPVIAGSDFTNAAWSKTGPWSSISAGAVVMTDDNGVARLIQAINGVTPGALVTFTWRFRNGIDSSGAAGNSVTVNLRYNGVEYWRGSTSQGAGSAPASAAQGGATCVSGCTTLAADTDRVVQIRLPTSVPITGALQFGASSGGGTSDDPQFKGPVSITNTGVCLVKKSIGGTGAFNFATTGVDTTMGGGGTTASITTTAVNTSVYYDASSTRNDNQPLLIKSPGASANVTITETPAPGFLLSGVSCDKVTPVLDAATNKITIASVPQDTLATCTVTNSTSIINLGKALGNARFGAADQFSVAVRTGGVSGTVVSSSAVATTTGSGATVTAGTGTTGDYYATPGQTFTLTEAAASGTSLANYNARLTCTDAAGVMAAASLPSNEVFDPAAGRAITPLAGANLRCTITNTAIPGANITLQKALGGTGRVVASDQFALSIKGSGTPVSVNTTGTGTAITSAANTVTATPGTAYTLDEAMATGSGSSLSAYTRSVTCSNTGPTSVSALTTLPVSVTPAVGDAISCLITNTPAAATVSGRVFLDNGTGSGVANDGILNGSEAPQAGIAVRLTDCAATPTVYASALTDGTGGYSFGVPASVAVNAALCVEQTNRSAARISTGASVGATALPSGTATAATGGSYTYTRGGTPDRIAFAWNGTGHANLNFGDVDNSGFAASSAKTAQPGSTVTYAHTFSAGTAGQVRFGIASETATPALAGWSTQVFADPGCTGSLQPGAAQLYPPAGTGTGTAVAAGGKVCIVVKQFVPASAPQGANDKVTIRADFDYGNANPALSGSYVLDDITTVSDAVLELRKEVRNVTQGVTSFGVNNQAKSGDTLEYRITYTNNGAAPIGNMVVNDATPGYTSFVSATTGTTPATLTGCTKRTPANVAPNPVVACAAAQSAGGTGPIGWTFAGSVAPGGTGTVLFQVKID